MKKSEIGAILAKRQAELKKTDYKLAKDAFIGNDLPKKMKKGSLNYTITSFLSVTSVLEIPVYMEVDGEMILINDIERTN